MFRNRMSTVLKARPWKMQSAKMSEFKEKSAKEVWLGDSKHYLHAGLIVLIITLPIVASTYMFETTPDSGRTKTLLISDEDIECDPAVIHGTEGEKKASAAAEVTARREQ